MRLNDWTDFLECFLAIATMLYIWKLFSEVFAFFCKFCILVRFVALLNRWRFYVIWKLICGLFASFCKFYVFGIFLALLNRWRFYAVWKLICGFFLPSPDFLLLAYFLPFFVDRNLLLYLKVNLWIFCPPLRMEFLCWNVKVNLGGSLMECILQTQTLKVQKYCYCRDGF